MAKGKDGKVLDVRMKQDAKRDWGLPIREII